jgi:SAM-dependent methyltransferase
MRLRDSGMPDEAYWETLFDVPYIIKALGIDKTLGDVAELGCGYGTFTVPVAQAISGTVYTFDIDPAMVARTAERARAQDLPVVAQVRDVMERGFGLLTDAVLLFNILHCEQPQRLIEHAKAALRPGGRLLVIHWRYGPTPRGPSLDIRPKPEQIIDWVQLPAEGGVIDLPPWHYGLCFRIDQ